MLILMDHLGLFPGNMGVLPRIDAWFEIHGNLLWPEHKHYGEPYINWLKQQTFPIYMQNQELVPNAIPVALSGYRQGIWPLFLHLFFCLDDGFCDDEGGQRGRFVWHRHGVKGRVYSTATRRLLLLRRR